MRERKTGRDNKKQENEHAVLPQWPKWSSQLIRGMPQSDPSRPHYKLFLFSLVSVLYTLFISLFVCFLVYWKQKSLHICQAVMNAVLFWSALCMTVWGRGGGRFGWQRERPLLESKNRLTGEFDSGWHCTFWALEWDQVCGSIEGWNATETTAASKQNIFPPLSKPSNNRHFVSRRYSLRSLFLKRRDYIVLSCFTYCCIVK